MLSVRDLVPLLSYMWLKGHCRACKKRISLQYPIVEFATAAMFVAVLFLRWGNPILILIDWVIMSALIALYVFDLQYGLLPDTLTLPAIGFVIIERLMLGVSVQDVVLDMLFGAVIGGVFFGAQWVISKGKWIGDGDIRLGVLMGILLGFPGVLLALMISYAIGSMVSIALVVSKIKHWNSRIALGPFLVIGTVVVYYWQDALLVWLGF